MIGWSAHDWCKGHFPTIALVGRLAPGRRKCRHRPCMRVDWVDSRMAQDGAQVDTSSDRGVQGPRTAQAPPPPIVHTPVPTSYGWCKRQYPTFPPHKPLQKISFQGIIADVCSNCKQFCFIANNMIVEMLLPELVSADIAYCSEVAEGSTGRQRFVGIYDV